jgi:hypothetical protein
VERNFTRKRNKHGFPCGNREILKKSNARQQWGIHPSLLPDKIARLIELPRAADFKFCTESSQGMNIETPFCGLFP